MTVTIKETVHKYLTDHGLWPHEADAVVDQMQIDINEPQMWAASVDHYPAAMLAVLYLRADLAAVDWIDDNKPRHFARSLFTGKEKS